MFKRKKNTPPDPVSFSLPVLNNGAEVSLEQKLQLEVRRCPTCSYIVTNPMNDRCPRCFSTVALSEHTNCGECSHQGNCTYVGDPSPAK